MATGGVVGPVADNLPVVGAGVGMAGVAGGAGVAGFGNAARLNSSEDPHDVYRVWIPPRREVSMTIRSNADVDVAVWAPRTRNVLERGAARQRDLVTTGARPGSRPEILRVENSTGRGYYAYLDAYTARGVRSAGYSLGIIARALPSRPSTRR